MWRAQVAEPSTCFGWPQAPVPASRMRRVFWLTAVGQPGAEKKKWGGVGGTVASPPWQEGTVQCTVQDTGKESCIVTWWVGWTGCSACGMVRPVHGCVVKKPRIGGSRCWWFVVAWIGGSRPVLARKNGVLQSLGRKSSLFGVPTGVRMSRGS